MSRTAKILIISITIAAILIAAIATAAFAAPMVRGRVPTPTTADYQAWGCPVVSGNYSVLTNLLGMTQQEITDQLQQGKSLVEIAAASPNKVSEDQLVQAILASMKDIMQQHVTNGTWTQAQLDARLKLAEQHIRQLVNAQGAYFGGCGGVNGGTGMMGGQYGPGSGMMGGAAGRGMMGGQYGSGYGMMRGGGMMGGWNTSY
jgi:hypothetical protein